MSGVGYTVRAEARRRWPAWTGLAVVIGLTAGIVTGLAAGARRTSGVWDRFLDHTNPSHLVVLDASALDPEAQVDLDEAAQLPGVAESAQVRGLFTVGGSVDGKDLPAFSVVPMSGPATPLGDTLERNLLLAGRPADPSRVDEVVASFEAARRFGLHPGTTLELEMAPADRLLEAAIGFLDGLEDRVSGRDREAVDFGALGGARTYRFEVVGVVSAPMGFPPVPATLQPIIYPTPAFHAAAGRSLAGNGVLVLRLDPDVATDAFQGRLQELNEGRGITYAGGGVDRLGTAQRSIDLQARAVWLLAALVALAGVVIAVQLVVRQKVLDRVHDDVLAALGMGRRGLAALSGARAALIGAGAAAVTVLTAAAVSPLFPIGAAAAAEPEPGLRVDAPVLLVGGGVVFALCVLVGLPAGPLDRRGRPRAATPRRPAVIPKLPLTVGLGCRLALSPGQGRAAAPIRSTLAALTMAVATAALAITFVASLDRLTDTPRLYGWEWDVQVGGVGVPDISEPLLDGLRENPAVDGIAVGAIAQLEVEGQVIDAYALDPAEGMVGAGVLDGRAPEGTDEIVLGTVTLDEIGADLGDEVAVGRQDGRTTMTVVGRGVFPDLGDGGQLGRGARITYAGLERIAADTPRSVVHVDFRPEVDQQAVVADLRRALDVYPVLEDQPPEDLINFGETAAFPLMVTATVASVLVGTLAHTLTTSLRRRRSDLALLKAIGLGRRSVRAAVLVQATVLASIALAVGLPLGIAGGRLAWRLVADTSGFPAEPAVPGLALLGLGVLVLVVAAIVAVGPAWIAARTPPARVLHAE